MLLTGGAVMTVAYPLVTLQPTFVFFPLAMAMSGAGALLGLFTIISRPALGIGGQHS
jgi:hypothetical protein